VVKISCRSRAPNYLECAGVDLEHTVPTERRHPVVASHSSSVIPPSSMPSTFTAIGSFCASAKSQPFKRVCLCLKRLV
jgi:hypothetical protein